MNPLHEQFISEARELVARASDELIGLEREGVTDARIDHVFRAFHTLKGSAGLVDLPAMTLTMHAAEDLIAEVQNGRVAATADLITQTLQCLDLVSRWIDAFDSTGELPSRADEEARTMVEQLRGHLAPKDSSGAPSNGEKPEWAVRLADSHRSEIAAHRQRSDTALFAISYQPHPECFFDGDDPLQLLRSISSLLVLRIEGPPADQPLAELDPFSCQLRFYAIAVGPREALVAIFRSVPDQVRILVLESENAQSYPDGARGGILPISRKVVAEQRDMLRVGGHADSLRGRIGAATRSAANALRHEGLHELAQEIVERGAAAAEGVDAGMMLDILDRALEAMDSGGDRGPTSNGDEGSKAHSDDAATRWLRVPEARIDALVNLAGEVIVLKNSFTHLVKRVEADASQELARAMRREQDVIERLASNLYDAVLQLRMVPIGQVLRPFPRLVRDLSQRLGKSVQFVTRGETTEFDKAVVDRLHEPLLHVLRNAVDHGIEPPEIRSSIGKAAMGTLTVDVSRFGDRVVLDVGDDGRGIDPSAIRRTAVEAGVIEADTLAGLSDHQVLDLIFIPGLSTGDAISDISGRGVGMDVVRQVIDQIGGKVSVTSQMGRGTTVRIDVPVSIATARIMVVECAGHRFGIAMDAVTETVRLSPDRVRPIKGNEGFVLRDRVVPICSLAELMGLANRKASAETRLLIVVESAGETAAVEIDAIHDRMDAVLKPMQGLLSSARGYVGTTILGDGAVLLVLDLKEILP